MSAITESARGEQCTLKLPGVCCYDPETTVWAHSNRYKDGKGLGRKAVDEAGAYACHLCHMVYDRQHSRPKGMSLLFVERRFTRAMELSRAILIRKGLLTTTSRKVLAC